MGFLSSPFIPGEAKLHTQFTSIIGVVKRLPDQRLGQRLHEFRISRSNRSVLKPFGYHALRMPIRKREYSVINNVLHRIGLTFFLHFLCQDKKWNKR